jgi:uncharacterized protein
MAFQSMVRALLPKDDSFYDYLEALGRMGYEVAQTLAQFKDKPAEEIQAAVQDIEHRADDQVRRMEDALARTFVTPIDREDLHRLTSELDDIIDIANLAARSFGLYHVKKPTQPMLELIEKLAACTKLIEESVPKLRSHEYEALIDAGRKVRVVEKEADAIYRRTISSFFGPDSNLDFREFYKQKEALDSLERAVDHCDNVADLLANLAVKHG